MPIVHLQDVTYRYPAAELPTTQEPNAVASTPQVVSAAADPALCDVALSLEEGEFVGLVGPNGAGKSTLCLTIAGFIPHFFKGDLSGTVTVDGLETRQSSLPEWVANTGLVFQNPFSQISGAKFTVLEEIAFGLENRGVPREEMLPRVEEAMTLAGISDLAQRSPYSLSGGQQQRVALASILVMRPKVLILDEPTSQLDPIGSREVLAAVRRLAESGMTVLLAEHKVEWIAAYADRVVALDQGRILAQGKPGEILSDPTLRERGFGLSRYTTAAQAARQAGLWPGQRRLPVTLAEAVDGFQAGQRLAKGE